MGRGLLGMSVVRWLRWCGRLGNQSKSSFFKRRKSIGRRVKIVAEKVLIKVLVKEKFLILVQMELKLIQLIFD